MKDAIAALPKSGNPVVVHNTAAKRPGQLGKKVATCNRSDFGFPAATGVLFEQRIGLICSRETVWIKTSAV